MRIVKHAIGAFCLLAALLLVVLWVRSYWVREQLHRLWWADEGTYYVMHRELWQIGRGQLRWTRLGDGINLRQYGADVDLERVRTAIRAPAPDEPLSYRRLRMPRPLPVRPWHGFEVLSGGKPPLDESAAQIGSVSWWRLIAIPIWLPLLLFAIPSSLWLRGLLRRRLSPHACPGCGYDLRASPERCPECGRSITPPAEAGGATDS